MRAFFAGICAGAVTLCTLVTPPAQAEVRILGSQGGQVGPFLDLFEKVRASGEHVVIDGPCLSACTLVLSMVPHDRISQQIVEYAGTLAQVLRLPPV